MAAEAPAPERRDRRGPVRLFGLLSWYDEQPWYLAEAAASLAAVCDRVIAVDGAYVGLPDGGPRSPIGQVDAITSSCSGSALTLTWPGRVWPSEVAKRAYMFDVARQEAADAEAWVLVLDADELLVFAEAHLRAALEQVVCGVAVVKAVTVRDLTYVHELRRLFRLTAGLTVAGHHAEYVDGGRRLAGNEPARLEPAADLTSMATIVHRQGVRTAERDEQRRAERASSAE